MEAITKHIDVEAPLQTVYNQWTQFEEFPHFMEGVESVQQIDDTHLHWKAQVAGKPKEWDAEIYEQIPDRSIAWRSTSGAKNEGVVMFEPAPGGTRITLKMHAEPEGMMEKMGEAMGLLSARIEGDLKRFKKFIESRDYETGAWRGEVSHGRVERNEQPRSKRNP